MRVNIVLGRVNVSSRWCQINTAFPTRDMKVYLRQLFLSLHKFKAKINLCFSHGKRGFYLVPPWWDINPFAWLFPPSPENQSTRQTRELGRGENSSYSIISVLSCIFSRQQLVSLLSPSLLLIFLPISPPFSLENAEQMVFLHGKGRTQRDALNSQKFSSKVQIFALDKKLIAP